MTEKKKVGNDGADWSIGIVIIVLGYHIKVLHIWNYALT